MDANTVEILKECNKGCKMAIESMSQVVPKIASDKFKAMVEECIKEHTKLEEESKRLLGEYNEEEGKPGMMASTFSWMSTEMKTMMHDDDRTIAKIMMDGCNMGIQSVSEYINKYDDASKESIALAKKLVDVEEKFMENLKEFL